jgi:hypothetical protein
MPKEGEKIALGGLSKGIVGMYIIDNQLKQSKYFILTVQQDKFTFDLHNKTAHVIENELIQDYSFSIEFFADDGTSLYKYNGKA